MEKIDWNSHEAKYSRGWNYFRSKLAVIVSDLASGLSKDEKLGNCGIFFYMAKEEIPEPFRKEFFSIRSALIGARNSEGGSIADGIFSMNDEEARSISKRIWEIYDCLGFYLDDAAINEQNRSKALCA
jgi:hypothetical protein